MDDVYTVVRYIYLVWGFLLFMAMIYCGILDMMLGKRCGHVQLPPEHYLFATGALFGCLTLIFSISEILLTDMDGGARVFLPALFLVPTSFAAHQANYRLAMHRVAIARGACAQGDHSDH